MEKEDDFFPWTNGEISKEFRISFDEWSQKNETEFQKTVETLRGVFFQKGLILPLDWIEVYFNWYMENHAEELDEVPFEKTHELMNDRKIIVKWAIEINEELFPQILKAEELENEKTHSQQTKEKLPIKNRFYLLDQLGLNDSKSIFQNQLLSLNARAELLAKIIGGNQRDCKDFLNGKIKIDSEKQKDLDDYIFELKEKLNPKR